MQTRAALSWRLCSDYKNLNSITKQDYYPLPFIYQILAKLLGQNFISFFMAILVIIKLKSMKTFKRKQLSLTLSIHFLLNVLATFQRCMPTTFLALVGDCLEIFMDDF